MKTLEQLRLGVSIAELGLARARQALQDYVPPRTVGEVRRRSRTSNLCNLYAVWTGAAWIVFTTNQTKSSGRLVPANDRENNTWDGLTIEEWDKL